MDGKESWADVLARAKQAFKEFGNFGRKFCEEIADDTSTISPSNWKKHKTAFLALNKKINTLLAKFQKSYPKADRVIVRLNDASVTCGDTINLANGKSEKPIQSRKHDLGYREYASYMIQIASLGLKAIKNAENARESTESKQLHEQIPDAVESEYTLLKKYPATPRGHIKFLQWVARELCEQAKNLRKAKYPDEIIDRQIQTGIKWGEAKLRLSALFSELPSEILLPVSSVLQRELSIETVQQISKLLKLVVLELQNTWEVFCRTGEYSVKDQGKENSFTQSKSSASRKLRGRKNATYATIQKEKILIADWIQAKGAGVTKGEFVRRKNMKVKEFDKILDRDYKRRKKYSE